MVSLTTVYVVSIVLTSIASFGSVFASKKFVGGSLSVPTQQPISELLEEVPYKPTPSVPMEEEVPYKPAPSAPMEEEVPDKSTVTIPEIDKEEGDPTMGGRLLIRRN